ncbi:MAG: AroM family protein [Deltaproteobacteria bacterium]|nr:AroM family protein [Deltaproteobacteria bacterium]
MNVTPRAGKARDIIGLLALGQTPRPDLTASVQGMLPDADLRVRGALDGMPEAEIRRLAGQGAEYPLMVLLADRSSLEVDMQTLFPLLKQRAEALRDEGARRVVLMCSGGFPEFGARLPVLRPVSLLLAFAGIAVPGKRVGIINPIASQQEPAAAYWKARGFDICSAHASPFAPEAVCGAAKELVSRGAEALVLDCMSFSEEVGAVVREAADVPVLVPMRMIRAFFQAVL